MRSVQNEPRVKTRSLRSQVTDHMVLIGFGLAAVYWLLDSFLALFTPYDNFLEQMLGVQLHNVWGRMIVLCLFVIFGSHAQFTINERKKAARKMERDAATRERFRRLLSPDLAELVVNGELTVEQGGESRVATVMFADIRGFTTHSRNVDASELLNMLNDYYEIAVEIVFRQEGTVDKFIGDGMMVIWGAPLVHEDDPQRAVRAALDIQRALEAFNFDRAAMGKAPIQVGIGINTGPVVAGYLGSSRTMSYSVIGDTVNQASRLCAAALPGEVLISDYTRLLVQDRFVTQPRLPVHAKAGDEMIQAHAVTGIKGSGPSAWTTTSPTPRPSAAGQNHS